MRGLDYRWQQRHTSVDARARNGNGTFDRMETKYKTIREKLSEIELTHENHIQLMAALVADSQVLLPSKPTLMEVGTKIFRARAHSNSSDRFSHGHELSFNPDPKKVRINRANRKEFPVFYGAVSAPEMHHGWHIANAEVGQVPPPDVQTFTTGVWEVNKPIELMPLVVRREQAEKMSYAMRMHEALMEQINSIPESFRKRSLELLTVIGDEFTKPVKDDKDYLIASAFAHHIYNRGFQGISYPSVANDFLAFNVAILPEVVKTHMNLIGAQITQIQKVECPRHGIEYATPHYEFMRIHTGEPFRWEPLELRLSQQPCTRRQLPWISHP